ncbi:MAG TPA: histidinol-phosphate transaminase [Terriglobia bacterium]|jgi:histidinol-phosphate aminotransferase|nr:histidinol-phosphate transaminase [Terriglobia bacterium]
MIRPRKAVESLQKYRPPREGRSGKLRLDFNENTIGCAPQVLRTLRRALNADWLSRYPEYEECRRTLAKFFEVSADEILFSNGVDDAIKLVCDTFVDPGDVLLIPAPTFPMYQFFHSVAGGKTTVVHYDENLRLPVQKILAALTKRTRWVALANPNNPTGTLISKSDLRTLLRAASDTLVLVDEAYFDFSGETVLPWINNFQNLVVTRSFSKAFGLAALRMGFIFANSKLLAMMRRAHSAFPVNSLALACALEAGKEKDYVRRYAQIVRASRAELCRALDALGVPYAPSAANFVLARFGEKAEEIARRLRKRNILVRDWNYDPHLRDYLRITVGSAAQTRFLIGELKRHEHLMDRRDGSGAWREFATYSPTGCFA